MITTIEVGAYKSVK